MFDLMLLFWVFHYGCDLCSNRPYDARQSGLKLKQSKAVRFRRKGFIQSEGEQASGGELQKQPCGRQGDTTVADIDPA